MVLVNPVLDKINNLYLNSNTIFGSIFFLLDLIDDTVDLNNYTLSHVDKIIHVKRNNTLTDSIIITKTNEQWHFNSKTTPIYPYCYVNSDNLVYERKLDLTFPFFNNNFLSFLKQNDALLEQYKIGISSETIDVILFFLNSNKGSTTYINKYHSDLMNLNIYKNLNLNQTNILTKDIQNKYRWTALLKNNLNLEFQAGMNSKMGDLLRYLASNNFSKEDLEFLVSLELDLIYWIPLSLMMKPDMKTLNPKQLKQFLQKLNNKEKYEFFKDFNNRQINMPSFIDFFNNFTSEELGLFLKHYRL